jgi:hypothetical protein
MAPETGTVSAPKAYIGVETSTVNKIDNSPNTVETGTAQKNANPYNNQVPEIGVPARTPLNTPIGVYPQFETPSVPDWAYTGGSNG